MSINNRVEKHIIKNNKILDELCFCSKNLYNQANYRVRKEFIESTKLKEQGLVEYANYLNYYAIEKQIKDIEEYKILPTQTKQSILKLLDKNWKSFFRSIKDWKKNPEKYTGKPSLPKYLDKQGRFVLIYPGQNLYIRNECYIQIPKTDIKIKTKILKENLKELRIISLGNKNFKIEIVYEKEITNLNLDKSRIASADIGLNNLMAITTNQTDIPSCLINGRQLKSINQYYNKEASKLKSITKIVNDKNWSNQLSNLTQKRNNKIDDYLHKSSKTVVNYLIKYNIGIFIIGHNNGWKDGINLGTKTNQNFVSVPFNKLIQMIQYKCEEVGIEVVITEESYTSKCDHLALETMEHHTNYLGKRIKRGLFKSSTGKIINSDINGAIGMLRKIENVVSDDFLRSLGNRGLVSNPVKLNC